MEGDDIYYNLLSLHMYYFFRNTNLSTTIFIEISYRCYRHYVFMVYLYALSKIQ